MKTYRGLERDEWSASLFCRFIPGEGAPGTTGIGGWMGPRAGVDNVEKRKILHGGESNPDCRPRFKWKYTINSNLKRNTI
jgi:hypothetical protein